MRICKMLWSAYSIITTTFSHALTTHIHKYNEMNNTYQYSNAFISVGDWGGYNIGSYHTTNIVDVSTQMKNDIKENNYSAILNNGDNFYYCGIQNIDDENISNDFIKIFGEINLPWISALGNHDYGYNVSAQLELNKRIPNWVMPERYYKTQIRNAIIYVLDTNPCFQDYILDDPINWDPCGTEYPICTPYSNNKPCEFHQNIIKESCQEQYDWFEKDLLLNYELYKSNKLWIIVIGHHTMYEVGTVLPFDLLIDKYSDLYINGHVHILGHYQYNENYKYITTGAASMTTTKSEINNPSTYQWAERKSGYTRHFLNDEIIHTEFIDIYGNIIYHFDIQYNSL